MALSDKALDSLRSGRIVIAKMRDSLDSALPKDRPAIVISTADQARHGLIRVVGVTHNDQIGKEFLMPMPAYTGFDGYICGSFAPWVEEADIKHPDRGTLIVPDMIKVLELVRKADAARKSGSSGQCVQ